MSDAENYDEAKAQQRFEAALRGAVTAGPKPMKDAPRKRAESKGGASRPSKKKGH